MDTENSDHRSRSIAIIGMSGRFPGANSLEAFWQNVLNGVESITFLKDEELEDSPLTPDLRGDPFHVKAAAPLADAEYFDAALFGITPREADLMDPQHRVFMECAWEAFENAGYDPITHAHPVGVFAGANPTTYLMDNLLRNEDVPRSFSEVQLVVAADKDYLATRVSFALNLTGPSVSVQCGCPTSLVAVHLACRSMLARDCDLALARGASASFPQKRGYRYQEGGILSPDGHTRVFDAGGQGTLFGSGVGVVLLKRLNDALADGDIIRAVIRGSAVNNDGRSKSGYTAPSIEGQAAGSQDSKRLAAPAERLP